MATWTGVTVVIFLPAWYQVTVSVATTVTDVAPAGSDTLGVPARLPEVESVMPAGSAVAGATTVAGAHLTVVVDPVELGTTPVTWSLTGG